MSLPLRKALYDSVAAIQLFGHLPFADRPTDRSQSHNSKCSQLGDKVLFVYSIEVDLSAANSLKWTLATVRHLLITYHHSTEEPLAVRSSCVFSHRNVGNENAFDHQWYQLKPKWLRCHRDWSNYRIQIVGMRQPAFHSLGSREQLFGELKHFVYWMRLVDATITAVSNGMADNASSTMSANIV